MTWKLFASTFMAIFLAELGDKTQLAAFALASGTSSRLTVFLAASLALIATTALAVMAGGLIGRYIPAIWLQRAAGVTFIVLGVVFLFARAAPAPGGAADTPEHPAEETGAHP
jgi:putative Ca2+/H+ antiporter (TMEM165/GDT1 family)